MKNKKGFTLIELLAVIVVLAVIMVIATLSVNKQIKKARKDSNDINKKVIEKAVKACLIENSKEECNTISSLQENGYLDDFEDPWDKNNKNLDNSYAIIIDEEDVKVLYSGSGITQENDVPPYEYFSWCQSDNGKHFCTDGLTKEGKKWLLNHDSVLIIPDNITEIKNCETGKTNCTNFSNVSISMLVINNNIKVNADFSNSKIDLVKIDSGSIGNSKFQNTTISSLIIGNAGNISVGEHTFKNSTIENFTIESGNFSWYGFQNGKIGTLTIGENVVSLGSNTFNGTNIDKIILKANITKSDTLNQAFRNSENDTILIIESNVTILPKNLFGNTVNDYNGYVHWFNLKEVIVKGDKTRFSKTNLYDFGLRWDQIPDDIGNPNDPDSYNLHVGMSKLISNTTKNLAESFAKQKSWFIIDENK